MTWKCGRYAGLGETVDRLFKCNEILRKNTDDG